MPRHLVFRGAPGTGKTTSARLLAELYAALGIVSQNKFIETDRRGLVGMYVGHTAERTAQTIQKAMGGVLFIDEAYSLTYDQRGFAQEAIATLVQMMENYRNDFAVFFAGYSREMDEFISINPGLASRISGYLDFETYTNDELWKVLNRMAIMKSYMIAEDARQVVDAWFDNERPKIEFGNARSARRLLDEMVAKHARRIHQMENISEDDLVLLIPEDALEVK
jgi:replication-associated recombination protein RarA